MTLHYVSGNILTSSCDALVNPVNCVGVMGKGLALQFKRAYPEMFDIYREACRQQQLRVGKCQVVAISDNPRRYVINFPTKGHWCDISRLAWIDLGLEDLCVHAVALGLKSIAIPRLGCGEGKLAWERVHALLERKLCGLPEVAFYLYGDRP